MLSQLARKVGTGRALIFLRVLQYPLVLALRRVERLTRIRAGLVLYGSPKDRFADNSAYAFLYAQRHAAGAAELDAVWITGSRAVADRLRTLGLPVALRWSPRGVVLAMRAQLFVVSAYRSDINHFFGHRAKVVNLWHGVPFKKIERDVTTGPLATLSRRRADSVVGRALDTDLQRPDYLLSPSAFVTEKCFLSAFGIAREDCWNLGYPRNDDLRVRRGGDVPLALISRPAVWQALERANTIGFFPTWRDDGQSVLEMGGLSLQELAAAAVRRGAHLIFKPHYNEQVSGLDAIPGLTVLERDEDVHAYLRICDAVITDYSSLALDFGLTGRPLVYYMPDLEEYEKVRGFYFRPTELLMGPVTRNAAELLAEVAALTFDGEVCHAHRDRIVAMIWEDYDFDAGGRFHQRLAALLTDLR